MAGEIVTERRTRIMIVRKHHPAMAQQAPSLSDILIVLQIFSLLGNGVRSFLVRGLDFLIALLSV